VAQSIYYFTLEDKSLVSQPVYEDAAFFDETMPSGQTAIYYDGTLLVSRITPDGSKSTTLRATENDALRGQGEMRYSSLNNISPELFPPGNRYNPPTPTNEIITFQSAGGNVIGFSYDRQYYVRKDSSYLRAEQIHGGFGVTGYRALDSIGNLIYFMTPKGIKAVDAQGQLDDVRALNKVIKHDWTLEELSGVSFAYDSAMSALFVLNPAKESGAAFYFNTAKVVQYEDFTFKQVCRGFWPILNSDGSTGDSNTLVERAFFVQDFPYDDASDNVTGWKPRIYLVDKDRQRTKKIMGSVGERANTLLDYRADAYFTVNSVALQGSGRYQLTLNASPSSTSTTTTPALSSSITGAYLWVLSGDGGVAQKYQIRKYISATVVELTLDSSTSDVPNLVGDRIVISPIPMRWVGRPLRSVTEQEQQFANDFDYFRTKHVSSVGLVMTEPGGRPLTVPASNTDLSWKALLYEGDKEEATYWAYPRDRSGSRVSGESAFREGESTYFASFGGSAQQGTSAMQGGKFGVNGNVLSPGEEIVAADVDFKLVACTITGRVEETMRTQISQ